MRIKQQRTSHTKQTLYIFVFLLLLCIGYSVFAKVNHAWPFSETTPFTATKVVNDTTTSDEATSTPQHQAGTRSGSTNSPADNEGATHSDSDNSSTSDNPNNRKKVKVAITTFNNMGPDSFTANGYVDGVIENDGTCTLTLIDSNGTKISSSRSGHINAKNTTCGQSSIAMSKLHAGTWSAVLSYSSPTATGTSDPVTGIEIQ